MITNPDDPVHPQTDEIRNSGLTIREYAAIHIMAGMAAAPIDAVPGGPRESANTAVEWADALIAALNTNRE